MLYVLMGRANGKEKTLIIWRREEIIDQGDRMK